MNTFEAIRDDQCPDIQQRQPTARKDDARKWKRRLAKALHIMSICIAGGVSLALTIVLTLLAMTEPMV
ncbi:TPA: hypothetical protein MIR93_19585 [Klebsiella pneumoniae]|nr:hypothetical protein [Klebsiella pneumoniae]HBY2299641.1 hypothetical protein [Klebsiella pneumoniae]HBY2349465.1 hypothetical protein [Klebsiella pneumoniae]